MGLTPRFCRDCGTAGDLVNHNSAPYVANPPDHCTLSLCKTCSTRRQGLENELLLQFSARLARLSPADLAASIR